MTQLAKLQRDLQAHIIDGAEDIADAIDSSAEVATSTRLKIYADAYRLRLIEALQANYPVLAQFLGDQEFSRLTQLYLAVHPSQHYSVRWFGHLLAEFLAGYPDYREQPWLEELAMWEWAIVGSFDASDAQPLQAEDLAAVAPDAWPGLRFVLHPSLRRITLTTNVAPIVKAAANNEILPTPMCTATATEWLIWRQELTVQYRAIDAAECAAIDAANDDANFAVICEAIAEHCGADEAPLRAASFLKQWLADGCVIALRDA